MSFTLTVLGSSGTYAGAQGACSGFLIRTDDTTVMLDAGPGTLANLQQHVELRELDAIVLSHCHPDHWLELPVMRNAYRYVLGCESVELYLTAETLRLATSLCSGELEPTFSPHVITDGSEFDVGSLHFTGSMTDHPVETLAFRVDHDGRSLGYTSDTGPGWSLASLGRDLDLAVVESTFVEGSPLASPVHLSARQAGEQARSAGAARLALTHVLPESDLVESVEEAVAAYGSTVDVATVHRTFTI